MSSDQASPIDVSRETLERLQELRNLVIKWTSKINLVSKNSIEDIWNRHIWDSAQLVDGLEPVKNWVDIGSGGGFPGLVLAVLAKEHPIADELIFIESDQRKSAFLRTAIRELGLNAKVITARIETAEKQTAQILSARALADLTTLLSFAERHLHASGTALFPKGANWEKEVQDAQESWSFDLTVRKSVTDPSAAILQIKDIARV